MIDPLDLSSDPADYLGVLLEYLRARGLGPPPAAVDVSRIYVDRGVGPADVVARHLAAFTQIFPTLAPPERTHAMGDANQFLLAVMIVYATHLKESVDLTLRRAAQEDAEKSALERKLAQAVDRSESERREILATIAHELRNPITTARGNIDLAAQSLSQNRPEMITRFLDVARDAVDRLARLSNDLVEASRGEVRPFELIPQDLSVIVRKACTWAHPSATEKGITLQYEKGITLRYEAADDRVMVLGNSDALLTVVGNLLSNAIRYTPAGGKVVARLVATDALATIEVADNGIGITTDEQARVFEKFFRAPSARAVESRGLGLGLSLVQELVTAHGGTVEVESEPGRGSTFRVRLPLAP